MEEKWFAADTCFIPLLFVNGPFLDEEWTLDGVLGLQFFYAPLPKYISEGTMIDTPWTLTKMYIRITWEPLRMTGSVSYINLV